MILLGFCERMKQCFGQITLCTFCLIACDIQIVIEISGYRHIDRSFIGSFDRKNTVSTSYFSSLIPGG